MRNSVAEKKCFGQKRYRSRYGGMYENPGCGIVTRKSGIGRADHDRKRSRKMPVGAYRKKHMDGRVGMRYGM